MERYGKLSRLFTTADLEPGADVILTDTQLHYLKNVLRKELGDTVRIFNGRHGEYLGEIAKLGKKDGIVTLEKQIHEQPPLQAPLHLLFAPIKKNRMDFLIEKAVELGATDIHPVLTARTETRAINDARLAAQIAEAAEQCERMTVPVHHPLLPLEKKLSAWDSSIPLLWCHERGDAQPVSAVPQIRAVLIGPEGGFAPEEATLLARREFLHPVSLGKTIYRAETAAILCLAAARLKSV